MGDDPEGGTEFVRLALISPVPILPRRMPQTSGSEPPPARMVGYPCHARHWF